MQEVKRFLMIGALLVLSGSGAAHAQRTSAPSDRMELLAFAMQPPAECDTCDVEETPKNTEPKGKGNDNPPPTPPINTPNPTFDKPDTSKAGAFNAAPLETLGGTTNRNFGGAAATLPVARHPRRGLFGIHPLAILVALIAVHVFVVTRVVK